MTLQQRFFDLVEPKEEVEETRTNDEIVFDLKAKINGINKEAGET